MPSSFLKVREKWVTSEKPTASLISHTRRAGSRSSSLALAMRTPLSRSEKLLPVCLLISFDRCQDVYKRQGRGAAAAGQQGEGKNGG